MYHASQNRSLWKRRWCSLIRLLTTTGFSTTLSSGSGRLDLCPKNLDVPQDRTSGSHGNAASKLSKRLPMGMKMGIESGWGRRSCLHPTESRSALSGCLSLEKQEFLSFLKSTRLLASQSHRLGRARSACSLRPRWCLSADQRPAPLSRARILIDHRNYQQWRPTTITLRSRSTRARFKANILPLQLSSPYRLVSRFTTVLKWSF
jgi:hypothetical protein